MGMDPKLAKKIAEAKTSKSGNNIKDGDYVLVIKKLICDEKYTGTMFIGEFGVVASEKSHETIEPNKEGSDCSVAFGIGSPGDKGSAALSNTKQLVCAIQGLDEDDNEGFTKFCSEYVGKESEPEFSTLAAGRLVTCSTYRKKTQKGPNAGKEGCYPRFGHVDAASGNSPEQIAERRREMGLK